MWCLRRGFILLTIVIVTQAAPRKNVDISEGFLTSELHSDPSAPPNWCSSPFELVGDQCLYIDISTYGQHDVCKQKCQSLNGELVAIKTATQLKNIIDYIHAKGLQDKTFYVDGSDEEEEGNWRFSTGEAVPMSTPFWVSSETVHTPNNVFDDENCAEIRPAYSYFINDIFCYYTYSPICEHSLELKEKSSIMEKQPLPITCPSPYVDIGGECFSFLTSEKETWNDALLACRQVSGELAAINDIEQLRALYLYLHQKEISSHSFWIGGSDAAEEGKWIWTDGQHVPIGPPW